MVAASAVAQRKSDANSKRTPIRARTILEAPKPSLVTGETEKPGKAHLRVSYPYTNLRLRGHFASGYLKSLQLVEMVAYVGRGEGQKEDFTTRTARTASLNPIKLFSFLADLAALVVKTHFVFF